MREDINFEESLKGEEGEETAFPCLAQVGEYQFLISYWRVKTELVKQHMEIWTLGLTGGGKGNDIVGQPRW
jgi:hypothetical protein